MIDKQFVNQIAFLLSVVVITALIAIFTTATFQRATIQEQAEQITALQDTAARMVPDHHWTQDYAIAGTQASIHVVTLDYVFATCLLYTSDAADE